MISVLGYGFQPAVKRTPREEAALCIRILRGVQVEDVRVRTRQEMGDRARELGPVDLSMNPLRSYVERRGTAYRTPPAVFGLPEELAFALGDASARTTVTRYGRIGARPMPTRMSAVSAEVLARVQRWLARGIDMIVASRRGPGSTVAVGIACEVLFTGLLLAVLWRAGWSFFHDRLWKGLPTDTGGFLWESLFWVVVCGLLLRWIVVANERRGLARDVESLATRLPGEGCVDPAVADFSQAAAEAREFLGEADRLSGLASRLTADGSDPSGGLGRLRRRVSGTLQT